MKHLNTYKIFESSGGAYELQSFCDDYLAHLYDEGFEVIIKPESAVNMEVSLSRKEIWSITLIRHTTHRGSNMVDSFVWGTVKSSFVPFFGMLSSEYDVLKIPIKYRPHKYPSTSVLGKDTSPKDMTGNECVRFRNIYEDWYYTKEQVLSGKCGINRSLEYINLIVREK